MRFRVPINISNSRWLDVNWSIHSKQTHWDCSLTGDSSSLDPTVPRPVSIPSIRNTTITRERLGFGYLEGIQLGYNRKKWGLPFFHTTSHSAKGWTCHSWAAHCLYVSQVQRPASGSRQLPSGGFANREPSSPLNVSLSPPARRWHAFMENILINIIIYIHLLLAYRVEPPNKGITKTSYCWNIAYTLFQFHKHWCIYCKCTKYQSLDYLTGYNPSFFFKSGPSCLCWLVCPIDLIRIRLQNIIKIFKSELHASGLLSLTSQELEVWSRSHF